MSDRPGRAQRTIISSDACRSNSVEDPTTESIAKRFVDFIRMVRWDKRPDPPVHPETTTPTIWRRATSLSLRHILGRQGAICTSTTTRTFSFKCRVASPAATGFIDTMVIPYTTQNQKGAEAADRLRLRPGELRQADRIHPVRAGVCRIRGRRARIKIDPKLAGNPLISTTPADILSQAQVVARPHRRANRQEFNSLAAPRVTGG